MRYQPIPGTSGATEIFEPTHCDGCGQALEPGTFTFGWQGCWCTDGHTGHRVAHCLRITDGARCLGKTFDPPHRAEGPTAEYGVSTHRPSA